MRVRVLFVLLHLLGSAAPGHAEVLVRWTQADVPPPQTLGVPVLVVPAGNPATVRQALTQGYRVYLEIDAGALATFAPPAQGLSAVVVKGKATSAQLAALRRRLAPLNARVLTLDERGKWPHIRSNWVTRNKDVLQVAGRSAQPWIESNAALIRIMAAEQPPDPALLTYQWTPVTVSDADEGPALEDYLVAIAEAGSFGADLVLPLHDRFQRRLLLGDPEARRDWSELRRSLDFYAANLPRRYKPIANIGVVARAPMASFEVMNLLARHNLPFEVIPPSQLAQRAAAPLKLLIVLEAPDATQTKALAAFERTGGMVRVTNDVPDPNRFALEMRQLLGRDTRVVDIWNGITVVAAPFADPDGTAVLLSLLNYAHQPLPVQLRVPGKFSAVRYQSPDEALVLLPHENTPTHTEFVVPALRAGARIFLTRQP
jgi:hypothetical protein